MVSSRAAARDHVGLDVAAPTIKRLLRQAAVILLLVTVNALPYLLGWLVARDVPSYNARRLELRAAETQIALLDALTAERDGNLDEAVVKYRAALQSDDSAVHETARSGLARTERKRATQTALIVHQIYRLAQDWAPAVFAGTLGLLAIWLVRLIPFRAGINIRDFSASGENAEANATELSRALSDTMAAIHIAHRSPGAHPALLAERIGSPGIDSNALGTDELSRVLSGLGDVQIVGALNLSLGKLLNLAAYLRQRRRFAISGSLQKSRGQWSVVARLTDLKTGDVVKQWEADDRDFAESRVLERTRRQASDDGKPQESPDDRDTIAELGSVLAYKILFDLLQSKTSRLAARSWKTFYHFTESRRADASRLNDAIDCLRHIVDELDPNYTMARFNLGRLYLSEGDSESARREFQTLVDRVGSEPGLIIQNCFAKLRDDGRLAARIIRRVRRRELQSIFVCETGPLYEIRQELETLPDALARADEDLSGTPEAYGALRSIERSTLLTTLRVHRDIAARVSDLKSSDATTRRRAIQELEAIFDNDVFEEVFRWLDLFRAFFEINRALGSWDRDTQWIRKPLNELEHLMGKVKNTEVRASLAALHDALAKREWARVQKQLAAMLNHLQPKDKYKARRLVRALVLGLQPAWPLRTLVFRALPELRRVHEWQRSMQSSFYIDCQYNYAVACYIAFRPKGQLAALEAAGALHERLESTAAGIEDARRAEEMRALAVCLEIQSACQLIDADRDSDMILELVEAQAAHVRFDDMESVRSRLNRLINDYRTSLVAWLTHPLPGVRATAHKTLGMLTRHDFPNEPDQASRYFESALDIQPSVNGYVYLAETKLQSDPQGARTLLELALLHSPKHVLAARLLSTLKGRGMPPPSITATDPSAAA